MDGSHLSQSTHLVTVVPAAAGVRMVLAARGDDEIELITRRALDDAIEAEVQARRHEAEQRVATLAPELACAEAAAGRAEEAAAAAVEGQAELSELADRCAAAPDEAAADAVERQEIADRIRDRSARARAATRRVDGVLEQRATAEAALRQARLELEARSDPGQCESEVRAELEAAAAQLARERDAGAGSPEALVLERRVEMLQRRLAVRADAAQDSGRDDALSALAEQAATLEARLDDAVASARTDADRAADLLAEAEAELEALDERAGHRQRRLVEAIQTLPPDRRPPLDDDPIHHAEMVAAGLRHLAEVRVSAVAGARRAAAEASQQYEELRRRVEAARTARARRPNDAAEVLRGLLDRSTARFVVLEGVLADDGWTEVLDVLSEPLPVDVIAVTDAPAVHAWAIDLPASQGRIGGEALVRGLLDPPSDPVRRSEPEFESESGAGVGAESGSDPQPIPLPLTGRFGIGIDDLVPKRTTLPRRSEPAPASPPSETGLVTLDDLRGFVSTSQNDEERPPR